MPFERVLKSLTFLMGRLMIIIIYRERNKHLLTWLSLDYLLYCVVKVINFHLVAFTWGSKVRGVWVVILGGQKTRTRIADIVRLFFGLRHCYDLETHTTYAQWWDIFVIMIIIWTSKGRSTINNDAVSETMIILNKIVEPCKQRIFTRKLGQQGGIILQFFTAWKG